MAYSTLGTLETTINEDNVTVKYKKLSRPQFVTVLPFMKQDGENVEFEMDMASGMDIMDAIVKANVVSIHGMVVDDKRWSYHKDEDPVEKLELLDDMSFINFVMDVFKDIVVNSMVSPGEVSDIKKSSKESSSDPEESPSKTKES